jgi:hypothetical protein
MRDLKYKEPSKVLAGKIEDGKRLHGDGETHYSRFSVVYTKYGIVTVLEFDWETNLGRDRFTEFNTVFNGLKFSADLNEQHLTDRQLRWLATHFAKTVHSGKISKTPQGK